ncbi:MAG: hypothetical protein QNJ33_19435 [Crocosphaera sp.]|nr:hypothetical protein [Crocosphaera sp.]
MTQSWLIKIGFKSAIVATILTQAAASYGLSFVSDRSALGANDQLDWSTLPVAPFSPLSSTFPAISDRGLGVTVSFPPPNTELGIEQPFYFQTTSDGIPSNYSPNDFVLFSGFNPETLIGNSGPLTITFDIPVLGVGSQLVVENTPSFLGTIEAFDVNNMSLGQFSLPGISSQALDNSAQFYGVINDVPNISRITFSTDITDRAIAINSLSLVNVSVPEPSLSIGLIFMVGCGLISKNKRKSL